MFADTVIVRDARDQYLRDNGLAIGDYTARWVKLQLGPFRFPILNVEARRAALPLHDLHHVATGYETTWAGEAEIGAWEVGAGCGRHYAAWVLDLLAMGVGVWHSPRRVYRAFVRGRRSRTLYQRGFTDDMLAMTVGDLRRELFLPLPGRVAADREDVLVLLAWLGVAGVIGLISLAPLVALVAWLV